MELVCSLQKLNILLKFAKNISIASNRALYAKPFSCKFGTSTCNEEYFVLLDNF